MSGRHVVALLSLAAAWLSIVLPASAQAPETNQPPPAREQVSPCADALDLVVLGERKMLRLQIRVEIAGRPLSEVWSEKDTFARLLSFYDRDGDGKLDARESRRLPSSFAVRQSLWQPFTPFSGPAPAHEALDLDGDRAISAVELADYYRRASLGNVLVGVGWSHSTTALTDALVKRLDTDGDGRTSEKEWRAAEESLRTADRNDDELIGPGDLVPATVYPGAIGSVLLAAPSPRDKPEAQTRRLPVIVLPIRVADTHWAAELVKRRDRDGDEKLDAREATIESKQFAELDVVRDDKLTATELSGWRKLPPDACWRAALDDPQSGRPRVDELSNSAAGASDDDRRTLKMDGLCLTLAGAEGRLPPIIAASRKRWEDRFADCDVNRDGFVEPGETEKRTGTDLKLLVDAADRDGDGRLSHQEFSTWLDLHELFVRGQALFTLLDFGAGLFEVLDSDHDGSLSIRELRTAWNRLQDAGCVTDGQFDRAKLPRRLYATVSRGHPRTPLAHVRRIGPDWFVSMDRNGDGDVSSREFLGPPADFRKLDRDQDGLVTSAEAQSAADKPEAPARD